MLWNNQNMWSMRRLASNMFPSRGAADSRVDAYVLPHHHMAVSLNEPIHLRSSHGHVSAAA